eukprot:scaffold143499_cov21-Tisochrysis_lutea.AAC.2
MLAPMHPVTLDPLVGQGSQHAQGQRGRWLTLVASGCGLHPWPPCPSVCTEVWHLTPKNIGA